MHCLDFVLGPTGGLHYHGRALRFRHRAWRPFLDTVECWLEREWNPRGHDELIIFGPSAGWTLPLNFLERFSSLVLVEPDIVARWLLARRLRRFGLRLRFVSDPHLLPWFSEGRFAPFLAEHPKAAILFANLLGQIPLLDPTRTSADARADFLAALAGRQWASYHDLLSAAAPPGLMRSVVEQAPLDDAKIARLSSQFLPSASTLIDHETAWLSEHCERTRLALWTLDDAHSHVIAFVTAQDRRDQRPASHPQ